MFLKLLNIEMDQDKWEEICIDYCIEKYSDYDFHEVPAFCQGDGGIEGFTKTGKGIAIQCYYPDDPNYSVEALYDHQRAKMTKDIGKLIDPENAKKNLKKFGMHPIEEWIFMTPKYTSKKLIIHADRKAKEVRNIVSQNLEFYDYIHKDFKINICTEKHIASQISKLIRRQNSKIKLDTKIVDSDIDWTEVSNEKISNVTRKVQALNLSKVKQEKLIDLFMKQYVSGIAEMSAIGEMSQEILNDLQELINGFKNKVYMETLMIEDCTMNTEVFNKLNKEFSDSLSKKVHYLSEESIMRIQLQTTAKWLADCSMEFEGASNE
ncbi:hypothetical protein [Bacillus thuringiensis]|uniref:Uncharacterized protein n=1 Tax=Bacillus thuringiensis serovar toumanoffi TaxID=180862 RepID=A0ABD5I6Y0_BACTU|nr:hypothetical protein [Bacillus thuringiensis]MCR6782676.1 hypothetical protein [Bacillus thuringiensis]MCR6860747.1 hypothetical protein [Bacillus thuringiensis]MDW9212798.1 hypothetical protein [Bacillus thuringiensis serovar toumanoffi]MED2621195.1 hypothetical protein [Bacillus thuringiensis]MED3244005.1 hypothetical protein [Bacillus thuringiensis]